MESNTSNAPLEKKTMPRFTTPVIITFHSFRHRECDIDNIVSKYTTDSIVRSGILKDDNPKFVKEVRFKQTKINKTDSEKTVITIEEA